MTDTYDIDSPSLPSGFAGPNGVATVKVNSNGSTQEGWGLKEKPAKDGKPAVPGFMWQYSRSQFSPRISEHRYQRGLPFAYVMRSVSLVCIDVDGKNGGFTNMPQLGVLPPTLAETSKSGNGYHLFYWVEDTWDTELGFAMFDDVIGIATGIDIRATGCVYHYPTQRWNGRNIAALPDFLAGRLREKKEKREAAHAAIASMKEMDVDDKLVAQHELENELAKPIGAGKRNNTLFAIGSKMKAADIADWEDKVYDRAVAVGLPDYEAQKLVDNIAAYGD